MFKSVWSDFSMFANKNPIYMICSIIYYLIGSLMLGGTIASFIIVFIAYALSVTAALSPLGERLLRLLERIRRLETNKEKEYLIPLFEDIYQEAKKKNPRLLRIEICVIDSMTVNACALGKHTIAVTKGAIETFSEDELKAILSHEIAHIVNFDTIASLYTTVANGVFTVFVLICRFFIMLFDMVQEVSRNGFIKFLFIFARALFEGFAFVFSFIMQIAMSINSRKNEYRADMHAYNLGYGEEMIEALYLLEKINLGDNSTIIEKMKASHPRITARIEQLELKEGLNYGH